MPDRKNGLIIKQKGRKTMTGKQKNLIVRIIITLIILALAIIFIFPFLWMISTSFKFEIDVFDFPIKLIPENWNFDNYKK